MKINVGSKNLTKVNATKDTVALYPQLFPKPKVAGLDIDIQLFGHPKSLKETIEGAVARAKSAFTDCEYSFGLEGGLMEVPFTRAGFMEVGVCAVYDGKEIYIGVSSAFEWPKRVTELILRDEADGSRAFNQLGLTQHEKLGAMDGGISGMLTGRRLTREDQTKQSIIMALIQLEKPEFFR